MKVRESPSLPAGKEGESPQQHLRGRALEMNLVLLPPEELTGQESDLPCVWEAAEVERTVVKSYDS